MPVSWTLTLNYLVLLSYWQLFSILLLFSIVQRADLPSAFHLFRSVCILVPFRIAWHEGWSRKGARVSTSWLMVYWTAAVYIWRAVELSNGAVRSQCSFSVGSAKSLSMDAALKYSPKSHCSVLVESQFRRPLLRMGKRKFSFSFVYFVGEW